MSDPWNGSTMLRHLGVAQSQLGSTSPSTVSFTPNELPQMLACWLIQKAQIQYCHCSEPWLRPGSGEMGYLIRLIEIKLALIYDFILGMLWSTSVSSDSSTWVSHFISEMIFDRVINSTPVAVWCLKPLVWPRNHEHKAVLSVLYLTFFDSIQQNSSTIWFLDWFPKSPASSTRPQFLRNEIPTFQAQCISCASRNKIAKNDWTNGGSPSYTDRQTWKNIPVCRERKRETDHPVESNSSELLLQPTYHCQLSTIIILTIIIVNCHIVYNVMNILMYL